MDVGAGPHEPARAVDRHPPRGEEDAERAHKCLDKLMPALSEQGIHIYDYAELNDAATEASSQVF
jgi:hypothetical protein